MILIINVSFMNFLYDINLYDLIKGIEKYNNIIFALIKGSNKNDKKSGCF